MTNEDPAARDPAPGLEDQVAFWDRWNAEAREGHLSPTSLRQGQEIEAQLRQFGRTDLSLLEVGCGTGWLCERLQVFGKVTATDITPAVLGRARERLPQVDFIVGDFFAIELPRSFDIVVTLEVLSHVADQGAFIARLAERLKPGGLLLIATQNRPVLERWDSVMPQHPSQIRSWVDARELRALLAPHFERVRVRSLIPVGNRGLLRIVNSPKLNRPLATMTGQALLDRFKERAMLGHTLLASALRRRA